jgi:hypothetical protein
MAQISKFLRSLESGKLMYWCQGCEDAHVVTVEGSRAWGYNGNPDAPTFTPSVLTQWHKLVREGGRWTGEYHRDANGDPIKQVCHTFITNGQVQFLSDCSHALAGQTLLLPELPEYLRS